MSEQKVVGIYVADSDGDSNRLGLVITTAERGQEVFSLTRDQAIEIIGELSDSLEEMGHVRKGIDRDADQDESEDKD